jgi:hypothetical protein
MWTPGLLALALAAISQPEVLYVDAAQPTGVTTQVVLAAGTNYLVQVRGTVSKWSPRAMTTLCAGTPNPAPEFPSGAVTGPTSIDAEWVWAWPKSSPTLCPHGRPRSSSGPVSERTLLISLGPTVAPTNLPQPIETTMTANHIYTYRVVGQGAPAVFVVKDDDHKDNYGQFQITISSE